MPSVETANSRQIPGIYAAAVALALGLAIMNAVFAAVSTDNLLIAMDNDDVIRLHSVENWLNGQAWYDMTLYRILPPEGVSLHWSRYVDAGIAAVLVPVSAIVGAEAARIPTLVIWPTLLLGGLILLTGAFARRAFGPVVAAIAVLSTVFWPVVGYGYFRPMALDHHNVQILLLAVAIYAVAMPRAPGRGCVLAGGVAALSLAVGLETLIPIALVGVVLAWRTFQSPGAGGARFMAFALTLAAAATLFFFGQTTPAEWTNGTCDRLGPPVLGLVWIGAGTAGAMTFAARRPEAAATRLAALGGCAILAVILGYSVFGGCLAGPYGDLPADVQSLIAERITEAEGALSIARDGGRVFFTHWLPAALGVLISTAFLVAGRRTDRDEAATRALSVILIFGWVGVAGALFQIRMLVLAAPVVPVLIGYGLASLADLRNRNRSAAAPALALVAAGLLTFLPQSLLMAYTLAASLLSGPSTAAAGQIHPDACRNEAMLTSLNALPPGRVLATANYGPPLVLLTHHDALAALYHRSAEAIGNGIQPFDANEAALRAALARTKADYLVLCRGAAYTDGAFVDQLASGQVAAGLVPVDGTDGRLVVLRVTVP